MGINTDTYESISKKYDDAISWMIKIGVKISSGRTQKYLKVINYWIENYKSASDEQTREIFPNFVSSVSEIDAFIKIYNAFKDEPIEKLSYIRAKLQKGVNGPLNAKDENPNTSEARNYIFEALVAAKYHNPEHKITTLLSAATDTAVQYKNKKIWIECKRVTSKKNLENNIRKASNQLEQQLKKNKGDKGLVALDFSKMLHAGDQLLVRHNDVELINSVQKITETFIGQYSGLWNRIFKTKNSRIIGVLVHFSTMATSEERNLLVTVSDWGINPKVNISRYNSKLLAEIATIIHNINT